MAFDKKVGVVRNYYPLKDAAKKLECDIGDVIHMGATGALVISVFIPSWFESTNERVYVDGDLIEFLQEEHPNGVSGIGWYAGDYYESRTEYSYRPSNKKLFIRFFSGFFKIDATSLTSLEFDIEATSIQINIFRAVEDVLSGRTISFSPERTIEVSVKNLCVMAEDLESIDFNSAVIPSAHNDSSLKKPNENKQSKMIKALIEIYLGKGQSLNPRGILNDERGTGKLLEDFDRAGIKPPVTGKTLQGWLEDVELEYVGISTDE